MNNNYQKHPVYSFPDASIVIVNENVIYKLHKSLLELASPSFVSSLSAIPNGVLGEYTLPHDKPITNGEFDILLGHLYHTQWVPPHAADSVLTENVSVR